jgi:hypothetical protein
MSLQLRQGGVLGICLICSSRDDAHVTVPSLKRIFKLELPNHLDNNNNNDGMNLCASLLSLSTFAHAIMPHTIERDRVAGRLPSVRPQRQRWPLTAGGRRTT